METSDNNRRIAKNTLLLYVRMFLVMGVTLYTSRVVLEQLGVVDYGVYTVVAGLVAMFGFFNGSISVATQRFLSVAIVKNNIKELSHTFETIQAIHLLIALLVLILAETIGLWFLYTYINIPADSFRAAFWVYQCSIAMAIVGIVTVPYISLAVSHERMKVYAYLSILEAFLKLGTAFLLIWIHFEKLILYAILVLISTVVVYSVWVFHTRRQYSDISIRAVYNRTIGAQVLKFVGWQTYGSFSYILRTQGINILINIFFGPVLNAARGIAVQVNAAMMQFVQNFQMAVVPQINKYYAINNLSEVNNLIIRSSKLSFLLMFILSLPILMETRPILELWLKEVPSYGVLFVQLIIVVTLIDLLSGTLLYGALATGNIKKYQLAISSVYLFSLPIIYYLYKLGYSPQSLFYVEMCMNSICFGVRLAFLKRMTGLSITIYIKDVITREIAVIMVATLLAMAVKISLGKGFLGVGCVIFMSLIIATITAFVVGLKPTERSWVKTLIKKKIKC